MLLSKTTLIVNGFKIYNWDILLILVSVTSCISKSFVIGINREGYSIEIVVPIVATDISKQCI